MQQGDAGPCKTRKLAVTSPPIQSLAAFPEHTMTLGPQWHEGLSQEQPTQQLPLTSGWTQQQDCTPALLGETKCPMSPCTNDTLCALQATPLVSFYLSESGLASQQAHWSFLLLSS